MTWWRPISNTEQVERELDAELRFDYEQRVAENIRLGMSESEARRVARLKFGGLEQIKEECRDACGMRWIEAVFQDLRFSLRTLRKNPGLALTAVAALTLGIGTNTAIFSVVNTVLLKPVAAPESDRVIVVMSTGNEGSSPLASEIKFNLWREQTTIFQDVSGYRLDSLNLTGIDQPQQAQAIWVTADYLHLFGLTLARGRSFTNEEEHPGGAQVVILSDSFWKSTFGGDPGIVGKIISLSGNSITDDAHYKVVGIMADGVHTESATPPDVWLPFPIAPDSDSQLHYFLAAARLKNGVTFDMANAQLQLTTQEFRRRFPDSLSASRRESFSVQRMQDVLVKDVRSFLLVLAAAVSFVLLIACANVANLLLAKAAGRRREIAIRASLGASRGRIIRQLLTESTLLSIGGGVLGLGFGFAGIHALLALNTAKIPRIGLRGTNVSVDWRVLVFSLSAALITGLSFGLVPALQVSRTDLSSSLKESDTRAGSGLRQNKIRSFLVVSEMSLALVLLIGAALLIRTLVALRSVNAGFNPHNVVITQTPLDPRSAKTSGVDQIVRDVLRRLRALPGVESAGYTRLLPLAGDFNSIPMIVVGRPLDGPSHGFGRRVIVSPGYFDVLRIPLIRGRFFTDSDLLGAPGVAIINQAMARQLWPSDDAVNAQIYIGKGLGPLDEPARQVIGIVGDTRDNALESSPQPSVFVPGAQLPDSRMAGLAMTWVVRTRGQSLSLNSSIQNDLRHATGEPVPPLRSMEEIVVKSTARQDFNVLLMSIFGASALLLATIGIYGLMAYSVQQRTPEMAIRIALGAKAGDVRNMVVLQGMRLALAGVAIGAVAAFSMTRFMVSFLFGVQVRDPLVFAIVSVFLSSVALLAVWIPAQRATRADPAVALRYE